MELAMVAIRPVLSKLGGLLVGEFTLEKRVKKGIESLVTELTLMHAALRKVAKVPEDQLDEGIKIWAGNVKELSYQMEEIVDAFMVHAENGAKLANPKNKVKTLLKKTVRFFKQGRGLHHLSDALDEAVAQAKRLAELRQRYEQNICDSTSAPASVDPRMIALYRDVTELVGIEETRDELINILAEGDDWSKQPLKTVSIVGFGGLGKTTLAKVVHEKIKAQFDCTAFVSVSQNPNMKKVFKDILYELDKNRHEDIHSATRDERQLIDLLTDFLANKRYLIVIDDIWDEKAWQLIKCAFSKESPGSRLVTTTRIVSVSKACCSSSDDIYKIKPLSSEASRLLFYKRVFVRDKVCPPELIHVSEDILQKCGGIPLAIITIASLLASNRQIKSKEQWFSLLNSIGRGFTEDRNVDDMKKILLLSYYDLPSYLKPCFLYLSIFPEDHKIMRGKLIWRWISEGFIYSESQEISLYELGDSYFSELVNRSLIQPIGIDNEEKVEACRVHDMVLDLIRSLSGEENFVTILDGKVRKMSHTQRKVRRLSIRNCKVDVATTSLEHVRSLTVFPNDKFDQVLNISMFQVLRVLDLKGCDISDIGYVGKLFHLRYLGLNDTSVEELPVEIGNLQLLQTLDLRSTLIQEVTSSVARLRRLTCLYVDDTMKLPYGMGNLTSLEELWGPGVGKLSLGNINHHLVKELGYLTRLRVLRFRWKHLDESTSNALVESLNNLHKLEILDVYGGSFVLLMVKGWVPPLQLRRLYFESLYCSFPALPSWINPSSLHVLSYLKISLDEVRSEDIQIVGMLPALRYLELWGDYRVSGVDMVEMCAVTPDSFPCATECHFNFIAVVPSIFPRGAAPRLRRVQFTFPAMWISRRDFDLDMGHLPSLDNVGVQLLEEGATDAEVNKANAALRTVTDDHPNRPELIIF